MKIKNTWLTAAAALLGGGILLCLISFAAMGFHFDRLSTEDYVTRTCDINEDFTNISIDVVTDDIRLVPSADGICRVVLLEKEDAPHQVGVEGDTLVIRREHESVSKHLMFEFNLQSPSVEVYLPDKVWQDISVNGITGDILLEDISCEDLCVSVTTGDIRLSSVNAAGEARLSNNTGDLELEMVFCDTLTASGHTGDLKMLDVTAAAAFRLNVRTGDISFRDCDAETIYAETNTGDITGNFLSGKTFTAEAGTGDVEVPQSTEGGVCEIYTNTGDIRIR